MYDSIQVVKHIPFQCEDRIIHTITFNLPIADNEVEVTNHPFVKSLIGTNRYFLISSQDKYTVRIAIYHKSRSHIA